MRISKISGLILLAASLAFSVSALAETHIGNLNLPVKAQLNGTQLEAGTYKVKWEGEGSSVQVSIMQGKKTVVSAPASVVDRGSAERSDAVVFASASDSQKNISEIRFGGKKAALVFNSAGSGSSGQ